MKNKNLRNDPVRAGINPLIVSGAVLAVIGSSVSQVQAHGFVGDRFFPPTIATDDPFATDELLLPAVSYMKGPSVGGNPAVSTTDVAFEFDKEIFPRFALGIAGDWLLQKPDGGLSMNGLDDFTLIGKYQLWQNEKHEALFSIGTKWEIGGSGSDDVGADSRGSLTPTLYAGKGLGDLPDSLGYLRPFAITGTLGENLSLGAAPDSLEWGMAVEYSLPYLQAQVRDLGLREPFRNLIPVVEFAFNTPENRGGGETTGTINPGVFYEGRYFQIGAEANLPVNSASGDHVGVTVQLEIFLDDIFPKMFGHPLIGR